MGSRSAGFPPPPSSRFRLKRRRRSDTSRRSRSEKRRRSQSELDTWRSEREPIRSGRQPRPEGMRGWRRRRRRRLNDTMTAGNGREDGRDEIFPNVNTGDDSFGSPSTATPLLPPSAGGVRRRSLSKGQPERRRFHHLREGNVSFQFSDLNKNNRQDKKNRIKDAEEKMLTVVKKSKARLTNLC